MRYYNIRQCLYNYFGKFFNCFFDILGILVYCIFINIVIDIFFKSL